MFVWSTDTVFTIDVTIWFNEYNEKLWFFYYIKMDEKTTCYQRNRERILNRAKEYNEIIKKELKRGQEINTENYLKKKKI